MSRLVSSCAAGALLLGLIAPGALAQPAPTPTPAPAPAPTPTPAPAPTPADAQAAEDARVRALVAEEVARSLAAARAQWEAEKAEQDASAPTQAPATVVTQPAVQVEQGETYLSGDSGFMDVRLNFTLTNENILAKPGETIPSVPGWRFGRPNSLGTLFFDNYDTRFSGYETLSHAIMYRNYRKDNLEVEGAFVLRINEITERRIDLSDAGSYILTSWWLDPTRVDPSRITFTAFPVSSDRFRLGYSYRLSWGGNEEYRRTSSAVPGFKLQYDTRNAYAFIGAKSAIVLDPSTAEQEAVLGFLAGAGVDIGEMVRLEVNGGYFDRGANELEDVNTETVQLYGGSLQAAVHDGMPLTSSVDYKLYKYDPERIGRLFQKSKYTGGLSWMAMAEGTLLGQTLKDPEASGSTRVQWGAAGDLNVRAMLDRIRVRFDFQYRDLAFILHSVPSLPTYSDFPDVYEIAPNFFAAIGADHNWADRYTVGLTLGIEMPATLVSPSGVPGDTTAMGESTAVIRNNGQQTLITVLPAGEDAVPQYAAKASGQIDFGDIYAALIDVYYSYDPNQTRLRRDGPEDVFEYEFGEFNQLGVNVTLQAKF